MEESTSTRINSSTLRRSELFDKFKEEQLSYHYKKLKKIRIDYNGLPERKSFLMNENISTPFDCARHLQESICRNSVVASIDNGIPWDMHKPLTKDCTNIQFHTFKSSSPELANKTFWRSCSFLLGMILNQAFKNEHDIQLCSFPSPIIQSGSFIYDIKLNFNNTLSDSWLPSHTELHALSCIGQKIASKDLPFEPLTISLNQALEMFADNSIKMSQAKIICEKFENNKLTVYRVGNHVDISRGPLMNTTRHIGRFMVTAFHPIETESYGKLLRVQGLAIPTDFLTHFTSFDFLAKRAAYYNDSAPLPNLNLPSSHNSPDKNNNDADDVLNNKVN